ncbi:MAG TPA: right-handed parallel beta-helix repeat-containing protein [Ilumatobacteraceae bacterium]
MAERTSRRRMPRIASTAAITVLIAAVLGSCASSAPRGAPEPAPTGSAPAGSAEGAPLGSPQRATPVSTMSLAAAEERIDIGEFHGTDIWVDPVHGADSNSGASRSAAKQTVAAAWRTIPEGTLGGGGYRIQLVAGHYPQDGAVTYWEKRYGSAAAPVIINAADGPHTVTFAADMNVDDVKYFYVIGVDIIREGDAFHCEQCSHFLLRDSELSGGNAAHDLLKVNQSDYVYIEGDDIHDADDNSVDFVAVEHGHVSGNRIHASQDWCMYAKGGSAYLTIDDNEVYNCGTGGITAGQGTGFEFMRSPWLQYEAYGIQITNNVIHDTDGAGLGVAGGYDIALAYNTLYHVGARSHSAEFVHGRRGCDANTAVCTANHDAGGWGSAASEEQFIPNKHVYFYDNVIVNPPDAPSQWQHFQIDAPLVPPATSGVPSPALADDDLRIVGNVAWNGPADLPSGSGDGCLDTNTTCNETQLRHDNALNTIQPVLVDPAHGDYRLTDASRAALPPSVVIPTFVWNVATASLTIPAGPTEIVVAVDQAGHPRVAGGPPGAL